MTLYNCSDLIYCLMFVYYISCNECVIIIQMHYLMDSVYIMYVYFDNCKCDVTLYYIVTVNHIIKYTKKK